MLLQLRSVINQQHLHVLRAQQQEHAGGTDAPKAGATSVQQQPRADGSPAQLREELIPAGHRNKRGSSTALRTWRSSGSGDLESIVSGCRGGVEVGARLFRVWGNVVKGVCMPCVMFACRV